MEIRSVSPQLPIHKSEGEKAGSVARENVEYDLGLEVHADQSPAFEPLSVNHGCTITRPTCGCSHGC